ncbi:MAG: hypothetical protein JGK24_05740 [Microcoleus sp. PH2017_29_MFU_D_A]|uniref:hypothetical protein n=1 Tax=unclassified Microcoleus TaxID=2642155 RepID=UPI001E1425F8|nr:MULTISPECIES: hypothetical protein [unclassified Microcoleus]MCC3417224.1 hypothetical protein [Microcoleus sp. PH2017_07_MST_O_A]MCC3428648.1 hypothetical protein [Microcoleus sp. PH2017_04_SCI_O_A]MCC3441093.1 hypothetical protein [Microcoleus sp. PH2017_03_ELD_O_A]MCC3464995.1 hypothetical protein [Microcoleus sp. PH2017_06_SFM_O_A]MCC3501660.1 hypothetical protein [Microcoleus sp. PH2017_19_SFW_U_A]TAE16350.1 MAG: hypothetical protein EAZ94_02515 [Oscillatoriales cyanobacterium]
MDFEKIRDTAKVIQDVVGTAIQDFVAATATKFVERPNSQEPKRKQIQGESSNNRPSLPPSPKKSSVSVALCLIVPASVVGNIRENHTINVSDIETLIENASYFLCTSPEDANIIQQRLKLTEEDITDVSEQREFYFRIDIADGPEMIGKKVQYILKRNLPPNGQGTVKELACLEYLSVSGLEKFNRV